MNPWLQIPASDYEGHMGLPEVDQSAFLADVFITSLADYDSRSLLYIGCATGNGLAHIRNDKTQMLTAVDINPEYLEIRREPYRHSIPFSWLSASMSAILSLAISASGLFGYSLSSSL